MVARLAHNQQVARFESCLRNSNSNIMKVAVIGTGNVGMAIAADLSINGHEVFLIKTSTIKNEAVERLRRNDNRIYLKED